MTRLNNKFTLNWKCLQWVTEDSGVAPGGYLSIQSAATARLLVIFNHLRFGIVSKPKRR